MLDSVESPAPLLEPTQDLFKWCLESLRRAAGLTPDFAPRDAPWGERYFHIRDPDGQRPPMRREVTVPAE